MPEVIAYRPKGAAKELFYNTEPELCICGPAGTGKTRACLERIHQLAWTYPNTRYLIIRKTRASLTQSVLVTLENKVITDQRLMAGASRENRHSYHLPNGSEIVTGGLDKSSRIMSTEYDLIFIAEATEVDMPEYEDLLTRLRNNKLPFQQMLMDCNPASPAHWIYRRWQQGRLRMLNSRHADNPSVSDAYLQRLQALTGNRYQRLYLGNWAATDSSVYPDFTPACVVPRMHIPSDWTRVVGIDFGFTNPASVQWWAQSPDGVWYLYREIYHTRLTTDQLAEQILRFSTGEKIYAYFSDHDAQQRAQLRQRGIHTQAARKDVRPGIEYIGGLFKADRIRLFNDALVQRDEILTEQQLPTCLAEELPDYTWAPANGGTAKEAPIKESDHAVDAQRYALFSYFIQTSRSRLLK